MIKPDFRIMPLLLALITSFFLVEAVASAATLQEIRIGKKSDFTRLVFQFEDPPRFQVKANAAPNELYLTFLETSSGLLQSKQNKFSAPVKNIAVHQDGPNLVAVAALSIPGYRLKTFTLTEPHRVVFDLYPAAAVESLVLLNKLVIKESSEAEPVKKLPAPATKESEPATIESTQTQASESKPAVTEPDPKVEEPKPAPSVETAPEKSPGTTATQEMPAPEKTPTRASESLQAKASPEKGAMAVALGTFQKNLILVLAGITIVILALVGFLMFQKRNNAEKNHSIESGQELKTTADVMASIDARIKEKFKQYEEANPD